MALPGWLWALVLLKWQAVHCRACRDGRGQQVLECKLSYADGCYFIYCVPERENEGQTERECWVDRQEEEMNKGRGMPGWGAQR